MLLQTVRRLRGYSYCMNRRVLVPRPRRARAPARQCPTSRSRILVPARGQLLDVLGRTIGDKLKDKSRPAGRRREQARAGGTVATAEVVKSAPDGYTMLLAFNGRSSTGPLIQLAYDVDKDLAPVIITSSQPNVLAVNAALPVKSVKELVA